jgi:hypothetical protein
MLIRCISSSRDRLEFCIDDRTLWFECNQPDWFASGRGEAALLAVLPLAMHLGTDIDLEPEIDAGFLEKMQDELQDILIIQRPSLKRITIRAPNQGAAPCGNRVATGLSCGIDSFSTVHKYLNNPKHRLTDLLFFDVGSHFHDRNLFEFRLARGQQAAGEIGLPLHAVLSNVIDFIPINFEQHNTLYNASAAYSIARGCYALCISSAARLSMMQAKATTWKPARV